MTAWGSSDTSDHIVSDGRVFCPKRGLDVDVETCWQCDRLVALDTDAGVELIRCARARVDEMAAVLP